MKFFESIVVLTCLAIAACSPEKDATDGSETSVPSAANDVLQKAQAPGTAELTANGLTDLKIGSAVPAQTSWSIPDAKVSDGCETSKSPEYEGVYAMLEKGKVERITLGAGSAVKLAGGIGVGSSEAEVKKQFPGLREEPHKYDPAPAKYLTSGDASPTISGPRFEIKADGTVGAVPRGPHAGPRQCGGLRLT